MNSELFIASFLSAFIAIGLTLVLPAPSTKSMKPSFYRNGALSIIVSVALSFCTAARNIRHLLLRAAPGMLLPLVAAGRSSARPCSGGSCLSGGGARPPCRCSEDKRGGRNNPAPADCSVPPSWIRAFINVHRSGSTSGRQAHRREGRASP